MTVTSSMDERPAAAPRLVPHNPTFKFADHQPIEPEDVTPGLIEMARAVASIAASRILALIAVLGAVGIFLWATWDPQPWRTGAAALYAILVLWPLVFLYLRKG